MITIFSTPRPFTGEFDRLQRDAIRSWTLLGHDCQIILVNDEENTTEAVARELGVEFIGSFSANEYGTPLLDNVFSQVKAMARYETLAHVNADILLFPHFVTAITSLTEKVKKRSFVLFGRRWDLNVANPIDFDSIGWRNDLMAQVRKEGVLHGPAGMDYWVFPKSADISPPNFCVGRPGMDSWLVYDAKSRGIPVIDGTDAITIVHQQHGYPKKRAPHFEIECARNVQLAGGWANLMTLREADLLLDSSGNIVQPPLHRLALAGLSRYALWRQLLAAKRWTQKRLGASRGRASKSHEHRK